MNDRVRDRKHASSGFTLIEVMVALVILAVGVLGLAGTTALVVRQVTLADVATERAAALQTVVERLRAMDFDSVGPGADTVGVFTASWTSSDLGRSKMVSVVTVGPGLQTGTGNMPYLSNSVADTFVYRVIDP
jgi:type IV pilus assembly protein PilV